MWEISWLNLIWLTNWLSGNYLRWNFSCSLMHFDSGMQFIYRNLDIIKLVWQLTRILNILSKDNQTGSPSSSFCISVYVNPISPSERLMWTQTLTGSQITRFESRKLNIGNVSPSDISEQVYSRAPESCYRGNKQ